MQCYEEIWGGLRALHIPRSEYFLERPNKGIQKGYMGEDESTAYEDSALSRMVRHGVKTLPSVSYTMLSGGTVRVDPNSLSVECPHRRNGSDSTEGCS